MILSLKNNVCKKIRKSQVDEEQKKSGTDFENWLYGFRKAGLLMLGK